MGRPFAIPGSRRRLLGCGTSDHSESDERRDAEARTPNVASDWPKKGEDVFTGALDSSSR
jgi:hypothetical protein